MKVLKEWFVQAPWGKIALISWGNPEGKPILLVHGRRDSAATFIPLLELLPKHFYYVGIDLPGHGKSDPLPIGIAITRFILIIAIDMVVKDLGWNKFYYIGHSMGSELGLFYNAIHPKQITKHVLLDPTPALRRIVMLNFEQFYWYYDNYYSNYNKLNIDDRVYSKNRAIQAVMRARGMTEKHAEVILSRNLKKIGEDSYKLSWDKRTKNLVPTNLPPEYYFELFSTNSPPTLYIHANQSPNTKTKDIIDKMIEKFENEVPNFKVLKVDGTHDVHFINPKAFSDVLCAFLNNSDVISKL
ncbi:unnamed protein product, partial [Brenthis ino]